MKRFAVLLLSILWLGLAAGVAVADDNLVEVTEPLAVDSLSFNGIVVEALYAPTAEISGYGSDATYSCAALVKRFYQEVYGVTVYGLYSTASVPQVAEGSFFETDLPQVGDIVRSNGSTHWALVKKAAADGTVTLIEQNFWIGSSARINRTLSADELAAGYTIFEYSEALNHEHDYAKLHAAAHPHAEYMLCACGDRYAVDSFAAPLTCETCYLERSAGAPAKLSVTPSAAGIMIDGEAVSFEAYNINGNNYFKLRDVAYAIRTTEKGFEVGWDKAANAISLTTGGEYTPQGTELATPADGRKFAERTSSKLLLDGVQVYMAAYNIGNNNYFKLQDLGRAFDFKIGWDSSAKQITIETDKSY